MKKNLFVRLLAIMCVAIMLFSVVACTKNPEKPEETTPQVTDPIVDDPDQTPSVDVTTPEVTERDYELRVPGGYSGEFWAIAYDTVTAHDWSSTIPDDFYIEENTGDLLAGAIYQRGVLLKDKLGVDLRVDRLTKVQSPVSTDISDGTYKYQLILQNTNAINTLVSNNLISDIKATGLDTSYSWYDQDSTNTFTISGKTFAVTTDLTFLDKLCTIAVFYNKEMAEDNGLGNLYDLVENKEWTYDKMLEMAETVVPAVDADGIYTLDDVVGISCQNDGSYFFLHSSGNRSIANKEDGGLIVTMGDEKVVNALEKITTLLIDKRVYLNRQSADTKLTTTAEIVDHFAANKALFLVRPLQTLFELSLVTENYGIIPMPIFDKELDDNYYTPVNTYASMHICFPAHITNVDMTVDIVQWLSSYSKKSVSPVFYEVVLGSRMTTDKQSPAMLDIIFANRIYDLGMIWNVPNLRALITTSIGGGKIQPTAIKGQVSKYTTPFDTYIQRLVDQLKTYGE